MKTRIYYNDLFYVSLFLWSFFYTVARYTNIPSSLNLNLNLVYSIIWGMIQGILVIKMLKDLHKGKRRDYITMLFILLLGVLSFKITNSDFFYPYMWFLAAAKNIDIKKAIKQLWIAQCIVFISTIGLTLIGIVENTVMTRDGGDVVRNTYGFTHPNTLGLLLLGFCLMTLYLNARAKKKSVYILYVLCYILALYGADSRTSAYLIAATILFNLLLSVSHCNRGLLGRLVTWFLSKTKFTMPIALISSLIAAMGYLNLTNIGDTLQTRVSQSAMYFQHYGITLMGQPLELGYKDTATEVSLYTLDNGYIYLLLGFGVILFTIFIYMYIISIKRALGEKDYTEVVILSIYGLVGFSETALIRFSLNFSLLIFAKYIWSSKQKLVCSECHTNHHMGISCKSSPPDSICR